MVKGMFGATAVAVALAGFALAAEHTQDTPAEVKKAVVSGTAVLFDIREADEWKDGHLAGAKHLALSDLQAGVPAGMLKLLIPAGKPVYLHCAAGGRCLKAADILKAAGYDVRPLKPGYEALLKEGFEKAK
jgi:rhodanese-related sulfurtransferase